MKTLVEKLKNYNRWRRGDKTIPQPAPKEVGEMIDQAIEALEDHLKHKEDEKKAITLKVGHAYLTRIGTRVKIVEQVDDEDYPFVGSNLMHYTGDGCFNISRKSSLDLVSEVELERKKEDEK